MYEKEIIGRRLHVKKGDVSTQTNLVSAAAKSAGGPIDSEEVIAQYGVVRYVG